MDEITIRRLVYQDYEQTHVDYKASIPWAKPHKYEIIKDIAAFANAGGGYLIIGVDQRFETPEDRRVGVQRDHLANWETTKVGQDLHNFIQPPLDVDIYLWQDPQGQKVYVVLNIPSHAEIPLICVRNFHGEKDTLILRSGAIYYRDSAKRCAEITNSSDMDRLLRRCLTYQREEMLKVFQQILSGHPHSLEATNSRSIDWSDFDRAESEADTHNKIVQSSQHSYWSIFASPVTPREPIEPQVLKAALKKAAVEYEYRAPLFYYPTSTSWPSRGDDDGVYGVMTEPLAEREHFHYFRFGYNARVFIKGIALESTIGHLRLFDPLIRVKELGEVLLSLGRAYDGIGVPLNELVDVLLKYEPADGLHVGSIDRVLGLWHSSPPFAGSKLTMSLRPSVAELLTDAPQLAANALMSILAKLDYNGPATQKYLCDVTEKYLSRGQTLWPD